jgi:hypothetical protein
MELVGDTLLRDHPLRLAEEDIETPAGSEGVDNHHYGPGMTSLTGRSPR